MEGMLIDEIMTMMIEDDDDDYKNTNKTKTAFLAGWTPLEDGGRRNVSLRQQLLRITVRAEQQQTTSTNNNKQQKPSTNGNNNNNWAN